jgi:predicted enzyme related to lactoylglutathione lyase
MSAPATLAMINLDCADPRGLAEFYHQLLGWEIVHSQDEYAMIQGDGAPIGFGRIEDYQPPKWPDPAVPKQFHLDLHVADLDAAERQCVQWGATRPGDQPNADRWRVLLDPDGHPFCICLKS